MSGLPINPDICPHGNALFFSDRPAHCMDCGESLVHISDANGGRWVTTKEANELIRKGAEDDGESMSDIALSWPRE